MFFIDEVIENKERRREGKDKDVEDKERRREEKGNRTEGDIKEKYINSIKKKKIEEHLEGTKEKENNEAKERKKDEEDELEDEVDNKSENDRAYLHEGKELIDGTLNNTILINKFH